MKVRLITISDIVLGYGSPQILNLAESICQTIKCPGLIFQPLLPQRQIVELDRPNLMLETIATSVHPYTAIGRREYLDKCLKHINKIRPDILLITNYILFDLIPGLAYRPKKIVHLALEDLDPIVQAGLGNSRFSQLRRQSLLIDLWIFPEANRAQYDAKLLGISQDKIALFYNVSEAQNLKVQLDKSKRIVYAGTLDVDTSVGHIIFDAELARFPLDVFGDLQGSQASKSEMGAKLKYLKQLGSRKCQLKWFGQIPAKKLDQLLPRYGFSLIYWQPVRHALLNAAPNKFFQAISAGVPVISAPHPQPKMLIERYGCGILLDGWSRNHLIIGLRKAERLMYSSGFFELLENCRHAVATELSWQVQIDKFTNRFNVKDW